MKRWATGLALATVVLSATLSWADEGDDCHDICSEGCANACSSVCKRESTREDCEIRCNPACYDDCEPRCATPSCGEACASTCASRCGADAYCANRCATRCGRVCDDGGLSVASEPTTDDPRHHHEPHDNAGSCPGQVQAPLERPSSAPGADSVDPDAPGTIATCSYAPGRADAPPLFALAGVAIAIAARRRRATKTR